MRSRIRQPILVGCGLRGRMAVYLGCAAALFVVVSCASSSGSPGGAAASTSGQVASTSRPDFVGYVWRLVHVTVRSLSFDVQPLNPIDPPRIQLTSDGQYGASDGVNYMSGTFTLMKSGFDAHFGSSTAVGSTGTDPELTAVIDGIGALVEEVPVIVSATNTPNSITMTAKGYRLTFRRDGTASTPAPDPSSTGPVPPVVYGTPPNCDQSTAPGNVPCPGESIGPS